MPYKSCPKCAKKSGPKQQICECGHAFQSKKNAKYAEAPRSKVNERQTSVDAPRTNQFNSVGRILSNVVVPAGECPAKLPENPTLENLREWITLIEKPFSARNQILLPSAIRYFARTFFPDIKSGKLKTVESLLDQLLIPAEEKGVLE